MSEITAFASVQRIDPSIHRQGFAAVQHGADDALWVEFYRKPVYMGFKSEQAGRPIYEDRVYCRMTIPSSTGAIKSMVDEEANAVHKARFPRQWAVFEQGLSVAASGTPLEQWPSALMTPSMVATCKHLGVHSVEQLAALNDGQQSGLGPLGRKLTAQAQAYLEEAEKGAVANRLAARNADLEERIAVLERAIATGAAATGQVRDEASAAETPPVQVTNKKVRA